ncbi:MAG TPA: fluoride efflux transporter CrcB [Galbitalea sp.]|jgi:CrcB protein|nr:fluoride efflux transporter CrcB [Galbitalea sp.]
MIWAAALVGGAAAVMRYLVSRVFARRSELPWAVFTVNVVGSAIGGVAAGLATTGVISSDLRLILVGGLAGGLTTFSTWSVETIQLVTESKLRTALVSVILNLVIGLAAATAGYLLATLLS